MPMRQGDEIVSLFNNRDLESYLVFVFLELYIRKTCQTGESHMEQSRRDVGAISHCSELFGLLVWSRLPEAHKAIPLMTIQEQAHRATFFSKLGLP
jgi:hypothetical protein